MSSEGFCVSHFSNPALATPEQWYDVNIMVWFGRFLSKTPRCRSGEHQQGK